jgi:SAM-dependent methyltransferase
VNLARPTSNTSTATGSAHRLSERVLPKYSKRRLATSILRTSIVHKQSPTRRLNWSNIVSHVTFGRRIIYCNVCGKEGRPYFDMPDLKLRRDHEIGRYRESLFCRSCGSTARTRTLTRALLNDIRRRSGSNLKCLADVVVLPISLEILDTDPDGPISRVLMSRPGYIRSTYLPQFPFGTELTAGLYNINLEHLDFESERFDIILSSEVMEHVRDDDAAHCEITRCLKTDGAYIFTVPYNPNYERNRILVDTSNDTDVYLTKPHFHGDPIRGGILAYRVYGRQIFGDLAAAGLSVACVTETGLALGIVEGDCFVALKSVEETA